MRSDGGIFIGYGVEETLKRHTDLLTWEIIAVSMVRAVGSAGASTFSFPEDVYILDMGIYCSATPANLLGASIQITDPSGTNFQPIYITTPSEELIFPAGMIVPLGVANAISFNANAQASKLPMFMPTGTDVQVRAAADAVGGVSVIFVMTVARCPKGVEIPH